MKTSFLRFFQFLTVEAVFPASRNGIFTRRNKIFKHWSPSSGNNGFKENMSERVSFPLSRTSVAGMENLFKNTILLDEKSAYVGRNIKKIKEIHC